MTLINSLLLVACASASSSNAIADVAPRWSIDEDQRWYDVRTNASTNTQSMISGFIDSALLGRDFREAAKLLADQSTACRSWAAYVSVNVDAEEEDMMLLCKDRSGAWVVLDKSGAQRSLSIESALNAAAWIKRGAYDQIIGMPCKPIFGSSVEYLTTYQDGRTTRQAMYGSEANRVGCDNEKSANDLARHFGELRRLAHSVTGSGLLRDRP